MMLDMFQLGFMQIGLAATAMIGVACGYLSVYVVLKRLVFLAVALAQLASASVALALFFHIDPMLAAFVGVLLGAAFFALPGLGRYLPRENTIGTAYALASAVGVLLIAKNASGEEALLNLLYGNVLTVTSHELWWMGGIIVLVGGLHLLYAKEFLFSSFDPEMAQTLGVKVKLWEILFYITLGLVIAMAIRLGGMMLVFALLVVPGFAALLAGCRVQSAFCWAVLLAVLAGAAGLILSFRWDLPTSAVAIAVLGSCTLLAALIGSIRRRSVRVRRPASRPTA